MIWGYHYFRKHPDESRSFLSHPKQLEPSSIWKLLEEKHLTEWNENRNFLNLKTGWFLKTLVSFLGEFLAYFQGQTWSLRCKGSDRSPASPSVDFDGFKSPAKNWLYFGVVVKSYESHGIFSMTQQYIYGKLFPLVNTTNFIWKNIPLNNRVSYMSTWFSGRRIFLVFPSTIVGPGFDAKFQGFSNSRSPGGMWCGKTGGFAGLPMWEDLTVCVVRLREPSLT